jgi:hypothetical protein
MEKGAMSTQNNDYEGKGTTPTLFVVDGNHFDSRHAPVAWGGRVRCCGCMPNRGCYVIGYLENCVSVIPLHVDVIPPLA